MKTKKVNGEILIDWWLKKYHNTTLKEILKKYPIWKTDPDEYSDVFYKTYKVTLKEHDEWEAWAKEYVRKVTKVNKKRFDVMWALIYLNVAPSIKDEE